MMRNICAVITLNSLNGSFARVAPTVRQIMPLFAAAFLITGCAHSPKEESIRSAASRPPSFLTGPMALLLTNGAAGFSARVVVSGQPVSDTPEFNAGELLGRGSKLLFAPDFKGSKARVRAGGVSFLWDSAEN